VLSHIPKATVQAVIGAIPPEAGVPGGEIILALAVLSVLVTSPIGAIGISLYGEKVLEEEELSVYRFQTLRQKLSLPRVGQRMRHKVSGTIWKVIEEREVWMQGKNQTPGSPQVVPAIHLRYWKPRPEQPLGKGKTMGHCYAPGDYSFYHHWEILDV
jgi:hypothetical protein